MADPTQIPMYDSGTGANSGPPPGGGMWAGPAFWSGEGGFIRTSNVIRSQNAGWSLVCSTTAAVTSKGGMIVRVPGRDSSGEFSLWLLTNTTQDSPTAYMVSIAGTTLALRRFNAGSDNYLTTGSLTLSAGDHFGLAVTDTGVQVLYSNDGGATFSTPLTYSDTTLSGPFYGAIESEKTGNTFDLVRLGDFPSDPGTIPTVVASSSIVAAASGTTSTVTLPTHQADDILVVMAAYNSASDLSLSGSWNTISAQNNANLSTALFWMRATGSGTTNPTLTSSTASSTNGRYAQAFVIRGCNPTGDPFEDATVNGSPTSSTTPATATIDTTDVDRLVVGFGFIDDDVAISSGWPPATYTAIANVSSTTGGDIRFLSMRKDQETAGTVSGVTMATLASAVYWRTIALAFTPPVVQIPPPVYDDWDRSNEGPPPGSLWSSDKMFPSGTVGMKVISNQLGNDSNGWGEALTAKQIDRSDSPGIAVPVSVLTGFTELRLYLTVGSNDYNEPQGYELRVTASAWEWYEVVNTTNTWKDGGSHTLTSGDYFGIKLEATTIKVIQSSDGLSWTLLSEQSATAHTGTFLGGIALNATTDTRIGTVLYGPVLSGPLPARLWNATGTVWNLPLPDSTPVDALSAAAVTELTRESLLLSGAVSVYYPNLENGDYSVPIFIADADTPRVAVTDSNDGYMDPLWTSVPIDPSWSPSTGTDHHMAIYDEPNDVYYEFWLMETPAQTGDGWEAEHGAVQTDASTWSGEAFDYPYGARATGLPVIAGLVYAHELLEDDVKHALVFSTYDSRVTQYFWPANRSDGTLSSGSSSLVEGMRFRLPHDYDLDTITQPTIKALARAARDYGMILADKTAVCTVIYGSHYDDPYETADWDTVPAGAGWWEVLQDFPWADLEVVDRSWRPNSAASLLFEAGLTFASSIKRQSTRKLLGSLSPSGTVKKEASTKLSAVLSFVGLRSSRLNRKLTASLSPSGHINRDTGKLLEGELNFAGTVTKSMSRLLSGVLSFSGSVSTLISTIILFTANLGFSGNLSKSTLFSRVFSGELEFSSSVTKQIDKLLEAQLAFSGFIDFMMGRMINFLGNLGFSGELTILPMKSLLANLDFDSNLNKNTNKTFLATLSLNGLLDHLKATVVKFMATLGFSTDLVKETRKKLNATLAPEGQTSRVLSRRLVASLGMAGGLARATSRTLSGTLSFISEGHRQTHKLFSSNLGFVSSLVKSINKQFSGTLGFSGTLLAGKVFEMLFEASLSFASELSRSKLGLQVYKLSATIRKKAKPVVAYFVRRRY